MTWEIFLGISALVAFVIGIGVIIASASRLFAELKTTLQMLAETLKEFKKDSKADREEIHKTIEDHERRIVTLEIKTDGN